jgi:hypothetical protein
MVMKTANTMMEIVQGLNSAFCMDLCLLNCRLAWMNPNSRPTYSKPRASLRGVKTPRKTRGGRGCVRRLETGLRSPLQNEKGAGAGSPSGREAPLITAYHTRSESKTTTMTRTMKTAVTPASR